MLDRRPDVLLSPKVQIMTNPVPKFGSTTDRIAREHRNRISEPDGLADDSGSARLPDLLPLQRRRGVVPAGGGDLYVAVVGGKAHVVQS